MFDDEPYQNAVLGHSERRSQQRGRMPPVITCPNCGLTYYQAAAPHVCAEWVTKENRTMNESEKFIATGVFSHERNTSGNCSVSGCPCRGWSAQESVNEHEREPPARAGEGEWQRNSNEVLIHRQMTPDELVAARAKGFKTTDIRFTVARFYGNDAEENAQTAIESVNQRHRLLAERERLLKAAQFSLTTPGFIRGRDELQKAVDAALNEQGNQPDQKGRVRGR